VRAQAGLLAQLDGQGVAEQLALPAGAQMPGIPRPDSLGLVAPDQLAYHGLDPPAGLDQPAGQGWPRSPARAGRRQQPHPLVGQQPG
jgi:hypothetical protein